MAVPVESPTDVDHGRSSFARLLLLVGALLALYPSAYFGGMELQRRTLSAGSPMELALFAYGCALPAPVILAVWLTWGGGRIVLRLLAILGLAPIMCCGRAYLYHGYSEHARLAFFEWLLFMYAQILILHALASPLTKVFRWRLTLQPLGTQVPVPQTTARWSLLDVLGWTAFAAMALALVRLHSAFIIYRWGAMDVWSHWFHYVGDSLPSAISFPFVAWAVWGDRLGPVPRVALIAVALASAFVCQAGFFYAIIGGPRLYHAAAMALGVVASAVVHCMAMRTAGVSWRREEGNCPAHSAV